MENQQKEINKILEFNHRCQEVLSHFTNYEGNTEQLKTGLAKNNPEILRKLFLSRNTFIERCNEDISKLENLKGVQFVWTDNNQNKVSTHSYEDTVRQLIRVKKFFQSVDEVFKEFVEGLRGYKDRQELIRLNVLEYITTTYSVKSKEINPAIIELVNQFLIQKTEGFSSDEEIAKTVGDIKDSIESIDWGLYEKKIQQEAISFMDEKITKNPELLINENT